MVVNIAGRLNLGLINDIKNVRNNLLALQAMQYRDNQTMVDLNNYSTQWRGQADLRQEFGQWRVTFTPDKPTDGYLVNLRYSFINNAAGQDNPMVREDFVAAHMETISASEAIWLITIRPPGMTIYDDLQIDAQVVSNIAGKLTIERVSDE